MYTLKKLAHLLAGLLMIFIAFQEFENYNLTATAAYVGLSVLFLVIAGLYKDFQKKFEKGDGAFFLAEALALFYVAWNFNEQDKLILSWVFGIFSAAFTFLAIHSFIFISEPKKKKRKRRKNGSIDAPMPMEKGEERTSNSHL